MKEYNTAICYRFECHGEGDAHAMPRHIRSDLLRKMVWTRHTPTTTKPPRESHDLVTRLLHLQRTAGNAAVSNLG